VCVRETLGLRDKELVAVPDAETVWVGEEDCEPDMLRDRLAEAETEGAWLEDLDFDVEPERLYVHVCEGVPLSESVALLEGVALGDRLKVSVGVRV